MYRCTRYNHNIRNYYQTKIAKIYITPPPLKNHFNTLLRIHDTCASTVLIKEFVVHFGHNGETTL
jgi:hypothetical protein